MFSSRDTASALQTELPPGTGKRIAEFILGGEFNAIDSNEMMVAFGVQTSIDHLFDSGFEHEIPPEPREK